MALTETQIQGHKKRIQPIFLEDLKRINARLGLKQQPTDEMDTLLFQMPITPEWTANCRAAEITVEQMPTRHRLDFFVTAAGTDRRLGTVYRIEDGNLFQLNGGRIMSALFESVDDLTPFKCPNCDEGLLSWDGRRPSGRVSKPASVCRSCGWTGRTGLFQPLFEYK
jgi:predicted RNA-binding Zn-ribbon protein involved in translation (DUF1610 family)